MCNSQGTHAALTVGEGEEGRGLFVCLCLFLGRGWGYGHFVNFDISKF